jgi:carbamoyl-phosphate synthase large subunit
MALHEAGRAGAVRRRADGATSTPSSGGGPPAVQRQIVRTIGAESARSVIAHTLAECLAAADELGYPMVVRPSFTMGGAGLRPGPGRGPAAPDGRRRLQASPTTEVLLEESILGWKEYELELMRDKADNVVVVCSIENVDPMGVHTGDSVTVRRR